MSVETKHPDYNDRVVEWQTMRDCRRGKKAIDEAGEKYLPMPSGFTAQADGGKAMYAAYKTRARFPDLVRPTLLGMVGVIHRQEAKIELPKALESLYEKATPEGLTLESLHQRITEELLLQGRYTLLVDVPREGGEVPYIAGYTAETLINWSEKTRDMFVLDESGPERSGFTWTEKKKFRALELREGKYFQTLYGANEANEGEIEPKARGGKGLSEIPLVVIGATSLDVKPQDPPLWGVADGSLAIYRLDADYRHQLFWSGQETLFCFGIPKEDIPTVVGAGIIIGMPEGDGVDAKYVGPAGTGIEAHRQAIQDEREAAVAAGARVLEGQANRVESGDALRLRQAAQTASITTVALASAAGLEKALRHAGRFVGLSDAEIAKIVVKPNLEFVDTTMSPQDAESLVRAWQAKAFSYETLYENLQRGRIATSERNADEERALIETEEPLEDVEPPTDGVVDTGGNPPLDDPDAAAGAQ